MKEKSMVEKAREKRKQVIEMLKTQTLKEVEEVFCERGCTRRFTKDFDTYDISLGEVLDIKKLIKEQGFEVEHFLRSAYRGGYIFYLVVSLPEEDN